MSGMNVEIVFDADVEDRVDHIEIVNNGLPDKPSELIRLALSDLSAVQKDDRYSVAMHIFHGADHSPYAKPGDNRCYVCLAGAVIANSLVRGRPELTLFPKMFNNEIRYKLIALDCFRAGRVARGLHLMGIDATLYPEFHDTYYVYALHVESVKAKMVALAEAFESHGI